MSKPRVIVLGAGYAGLRATLSLAKKTPAQVVLVNAEPVFVERIRLHQQAAGQKITEHALSDLLSGTGVEFVQGRVTGLLPGQRQIEIDTAEGHRLLNYDKLVYALGSMVDPDSVEGIREFAQVYLPGQATELHRKLAALPSGARLVVAGGGLTGIETATEMAGAYPHLALKLVTRGEFAAHFSRAGRNYLRATMERLHIALQDKTEIEKIKAGSIQTSQGELPYDLLIWAGSLTTPGLARQAGIATNPKGQIRVDHCLRSVSHPDIFATGDAAYLENFVPELRMACATALPLGSLVARNVAAALAQRPLKPHRFKYYFRCISLGRHDGLIQFVNGDDTPREMVLTGKISARIKEEICRYALRTVTRGYRPASSPKKEAAPEKATVA